MDVAARPHRPRRGRRRAGGPQRLGRGAAHARRGRRAGPGGRRPDLPPSSTPVPRRPRRAVRALWGWRDDVGLLPSPVRWAGSATAGWTVEAAARLARSRSPDRRRGLAAVRRAGAGRCPRRRRRAAPRPHPAGRRGPGDAADLPPRRLEARQPRQRARRPDGAARLGLSRRGPAVPRAGLVPGPQPGPAPESEGVDDRRLPRPRSSATASTPRGGASASSGCACSAPWCSSAGRRRSATTPSSAGGATGGRRGGDGCEAVGRCQPWRLRRRLPR